MLSFPNSPRTKRAMVSLKATKRAPKPGKGAGERQGERVSISIVEQGVEHMAAIKSVCVHMHTREKKRKRDLCMHLCLCVHAHGARE